MKQIIINFKIHWQVILKHTLHAMIVTTLAVVVHSLQASMLMYLPLVLVFTLLIFKGTHKKTKIQLKQLSQSLVVSVPFAIIVSSYASQYLWTLPIIMLVYMLVISWLKFPPIYVFGGILIIFAYFSSYAWSFYIYQTLDALLFSCLAYVVGFLFYSQPQDQFKVIYREVTSIFSQLLPEVLEGQYRNVSSFFVGYHTMQQLFETMREEAIMPIHEQLRYEQLLWEMEETYFYLRTLVDAPIMLTENLYEAYEGTGISLHREKILLGESPYNFHAKNLLRHLRQWKYLEKMLMQEGLL